MNIRMKPLAALLPLLFVTQAHAATGSTLDELLVTASRQATRVSEALADVTVIDREELSAAGQSTLEEILARQPGLELGANGSFGATSSIYVRGTNSNHVLLLVDGMRVGSATSGTVAWSRLPVDQIERIEILRGPASALYGSDAIGGIVQVFTRQGDGPARFSGEIGGGSYGTHSASGGVTGSSESWRYALRASTYQTQGFNSKPWDATANPNRNGFDNQSISGRLGYTFAKGHELGVSALYSDGENSYDGSGVTDTWKTRVQVGSLNLNLKNALTAQWNSTLQVGFSQDHQNTTKNGVFNNRYNTNQRQYSWQNDIRSNFGLFLLGAERLEQEIESSSTFTSTERSINSLLAGWRQSWREHSLQANVRHDDNSQFGEKNTGSLAYGYRFNPNWRANLSYGTAFKAPTFNDLYYPLDNWGYKGNPNLRPETAHNREASLHYESGGQHVSLTGFLNKVHDLINWQGVSPINIGEAQLSGATLAYEGQVKDFQLTAHYTHQQADDVTNHQRLARRARNYGGFSIGQNLGAWDWRTEVQASGNRVDYSGFPTKQVTLGGYTLVNLYGSYRLDSSWSLFARINNLFDKQYVLADGYATPGLNAFVGIRYTPK